jgi:hypothetical protein
MLKQLRTSAGGFGSRTHAKDRSSRKIKSAAEVSKVRREDRILGCEPRSSAERWTFGRKFEFSTEQWNPSTEKGNSLLKISNALVKSAPVAENQNPSQKIGFCRGISNGLPEDRKNQPQYQPLRRRSLNAVEELECAAENSNRPRKANPSGGQSKLHRISWFFH